jgi:hypothetical protein
MDWQNLETFSFGDNSDLANRLLELVLSGTKRATCWAESQGLLSAEIGKLMVVLGEKKMARIAQVVFIALMLMSPAVGRKIGYDRFSPLRHNGTNSSQKNCIRTIVLGNDLLQPSVKLTDIGLAEFPVGAQLSQHISKVRFIEMRSSHS